MTDEDDGVVSIFSQFQDVTERTTRQRELEAQVTAMEAASDGIAILDHDGEFVYTNPSHAAIYGFDNPDGGCHRTLLTP
ncbi:PAS domain-containing protein [Haloplanus salilacus]|uniref:PAS domain-containing protein n=1 Tax=Haloplanus salilacus TaxID=2949994 RepID=UPI003CCC9CC3